MRLARGQNEDIEQVDCLLDRDALLGCPLSPDFKGRRLFLQPYVVSAGLNEHFGEWLLFGSLNQWQNLRRICGTLEIIFLRNTRFFLQWSWICVRHLCAATQSSLEHSLIHMYIGTRQSTGTFKNVKLSRDRYMLQVNIPRRPSLPVARRYY